MPVSPARSLRRLASPIVAWGLILLCSPAGAHGQDPEMPRRMPVGAPTDLEQLSAAAKAQDAAAGGKAGFSKVDQQRLSAAAVQQAPLPGRVLSSAGQVLVINAAKEAVKSQYQFRPGSAAYAQALEESLIEHRAKAYGLPSPSPPRPISLAPTAPGSDVQQAVRKELAAMSSLKRDPAWLKNHDKWLTQVLKQPNPLRVLGGDSAGDTEFLDCVAVLPNPEDAGSCGLCSGTLIGKNVVLTAAHCVLDGCKGRVFIGPNSNVTKGGVLIPIKASIPHPKYDALSGSNDVAVLILERDADGDFPSLTAKGGKVVVPVRELAGKADIDGASFVEVVGFGVTTTLMQQAGVKTKVQLPIASVACKDSGSDKYGCNSGSELVAGGNGYDSCHGDSGGPAYVQVGSVYKLAGVTSRGTSNSVTDCGDGGIYTRVDVYADWIVSTAQAKGGHLR